MIENKDDQQIIDTSLVEYEPFLNYNISFSNDTSSKLPEPVKIQFNEGSKGNTTDRKELLHEFQILGSNERILYFRRGDQLPHKSRDIGYYYILNDTNDIIKMVTYYTPSFPCSIISPGDYRYRHKDKYTKYKVEHRIKTGAGRCIFVGIKG